MPLLTTLQEKERKKKEEGKEKEKERKKREREKNVVVSARDLQVLQVLSVASCGPLHTEPSPVSEAKVISFSSPFSSSAVAKQSQPWSPKQATPPKLE